MPRCSNCGRENPEDASFCLACGSAVSSEVGMPGLRKTVTVLFCDLAGSTALGETVDTESVRRVMSAYFDAARSAIERHGGVVEKFIGDAVMAVFGVPA